MTAPLAPYQYEMVYMLLREPLSASEVHDEFVYRLLSRQFGSRQAVVSHLGDLVKRGWIERSPTGIYRATEKARRAVSW